MTADDRARALLRQERSRGTRKKLADAAQRLWAERGFDETPVAELCEAAGVSTGSFHYHFRRKEDLLVELTLGPGIAEFRSVVEGSWEEPLPTAALLRLGLDAMAAAISERPPALVRRAIVELYRALDDPKLVDMQGERPGLVAMFTDLFERAIGRGELPGRYGPRELGVLLTSVVLHSILMWAIGGMGDLSLGAAVWRHANLILGGAGVGP